MHALRLYLEPRLSFLDDMMCPVKFSDCGLLSVGGDQLDTTIGLGISVECSNVHGGSEQEPTLG